MSLLAITSLDRQMDAFIINYNKLLKENEQLKIENESLKQQVESYVKTRRDDSSKDF
jgi:regulator of replication initiation timing